MEMSEELKQLIHEEGFVKKDEHQALFVRTKNAAIISHAKELLAYVQHLSSDIHRNMSDFEKHKCNIHAMHGVWIYSYENLFHLVEDSGCVDSRKTGEVEFGFMYDCVSFEGELPKRLNTVVLESQRPKFSELYQNCK